MSAPDPGGPFRSDSGESGLEWLSGAAVDTLDVDWQAAESSRHSAEDRAIIEQLRMLSRMARILHEGEGGLSAATTIGDSAAERAPGSAAQTAAEPVRPPQSWGAFEIRGTIGSGTFGTVFRAWEPGLERDVALKLLRVRETEDPGRLVDEARVLAQVRHDNIVTVFGADRADGRVGFWMEFIDGRTLRQMQEERGPFSAEEALLIGQDLCHALAAVHRAGLLHCDVKAQNVMRAIGGRTVLMDFGGAAVAHARAGSNPLVVGTPLYLAPEMLEGASPSVRTDVYSLGVLLFYLVSGEFPVPASSMQQLRRAHAARQRRWLRDVRPDLPAAFIRVVDDATAVLPEHRPDSMGAMDVLLERAAGRPSAGPGRSRRWPLPGSGAERSVAVLPFADMSPDGTLGYFCEGTAEEIIDALNRAPGVRVVARSSSFRFRTGANDPREIGAMLKADHVLEGSVRVSGERVRVSARLIDASDGGLVWSEKFEHRLADLFAVQDEIAQAVARALGGRGEAAASTPGTRDGEAYTLYLKGRFCWNQRAEAALARAVAYFEAAVAKDPGYAEAYAGLATAYTTLGLYGARSPRECMPAAKQAASRAIELAGISSSASATLGCITAVFDRAWRDAEDHYRRAIEADPNHPMARHWYAINYLTPLRRFEEAARELQRAGESDPLSTPIRVSGGILHYFAHRYDEAQHQLRESLEFDAGSSTARLFLGLTLVEAGRPDEALHELEMARQLSPTPEMSAAIGYVGGRMGAADTAQRALTDLRARAAERYVSPSLIAQVHAGLGNTGEALGWLEQALEVRAVDLAWLSVRPVFDALRMNPRFRAILDALGQ